MKSRMLRSTGPEIIGFTISSARLMPIHIMPREVSSSRMLVGYFVESIQKLRKRARESTWVISRAILYWHSKKSMCIGVNYEWCLFDDERILKISSYFRYYVVLMPLMCFILPTVIPVVFWNETWMNAYFIPTVFRYVFTLNMTWLVNSAAHLFGNKPYDKLVLIILIN